MNTRLEGLAIGEAVQCHSTVESRTYSPPSPFLPASIGQNRGVDLRVSAQFKDSVLTGQDDRSNPDLTGHFKVCLAISVSLDFIESVPTIKPLMVLFMVLFMVLHVFMDVIFTVVQQ